VRDFILFKINYGSQCTFFPAVLHLKQRWKEYHPPHFRRQLAARSLTPP
jgi:hypothetical protein